MSPAHRDRRIRVLSPRPIETFLPMAGRPQL
jgi:hypothetical protein